MAASTTAYPPSSASQRRPPAPPSAPFHRAQSQSASSTYVPSLPTRPNGTPGSQPFKPMYDLPPGFHQQTQSVGGGGAGGGLPQRGAAGGLNRLRSPPLPHAVRGSSSAGSAGGLSSSSSSSANLRPAGQTPPLHAPQPRRPRPSPTLLNTASPPPAPPSLRSSTPGSASVFSKAPQNSSSPAPRDIALFSEHCRRVFYDGDGQSQRYVDHVLRSIPPSHKAAFIREQNRVRQEFHQSESLRRRMDFEALLASTAAGGALTIKNRRDPRGASARKERRDRLKRFLETHAGKGNVGPAPLLSSLAAVLRLQAQADKKGGAGASRVEWEVDDAVWMECGGKDFMVDALAVVKGVLGFEDVPRVRSRRRSEPASTALRSPLLPPTAAAPFARSNLSRTPSSNASPTTEHGSPGQDTPFLPSAAASAAAGGASSGRKRGKAPAPPSTAARAPPPSSSASYDPTAPSDPLRPRASSDPFSDARNGGHRRGPAPPVPTKAHFHPMQLPATAYQPTVLKDRTFSHGSAFSATEMEPTTPGAEDHHLLSSAVEDEDDDSDALSDGSSDEAFDALGGPLAAPRWRTWVAPAHLTDPELSALLRLFPSHLAKPSRAGRFPYLGPSQAAVEAGEPTRGGGRAGDGRSEGRGVVECATWSGTGRVWKGAKAREAGWTGSGWARFCEWWRALFS